MKVGFLTSNHLPEARGGTEQVTAALEREFRTRGIAVFAITSSDVPDDAGPVRREVWDGIAVHRLQKRLDEWDHQGFTRPRLLGLVRDLLARERPDVLHVHSEAALGTGCVLVARELGIPVVFTFHDLWATCARYFRLPPVGITCPSGVDRGACGPCLDRDLHVGVERVHAVLAARDAAVRADVAAAQAWTAPSAATARVVRVCVPFDGAVQVVPHGLLRAIPAGERAAGRRQGDPLRIGTFGGVGPEKGTVELLDALAGLPCAVHLAGRHLAPVVQAAVDRVRAAGMVVVLRGEYGPGDRHPARDLDLAVFPSKCQETYGLVVDEALAHGVPCVLSDNGAFADRDGQPGVVVTPLAKLGPVLHDLVAHPERIDALRAAIPAGLPTIATAADRYLALYRSLA